MSELLGKDLSLNSCRERGVALSDSFKRNCSRFAELMVLAVRAARGIVSKAFVYE